MDQLQSTIIIITKTYNVEDYVYEMNENLNALRSNYRNNVDLTATVINPFTADSSTPGTTQFSIICDKCDSISDDALIVRDTFDIIIAETLRITVDLIKKFEPLYEVRQNIMEYASILFEDLEGVITAIEKQQTEISSFFVTGSELDEKYRETWIAFFLSFTLIIVSLPICGMLCKC